MKIQDVFRGRHLKEEETSRAAKLEATIKKMIEDHIKEILQMFHGAGATAELASHSTIDAGHFRYGNTLHGEGQYSGAEFSFTIESGELTYLRFGKVSVNAKSLNTAAEMKAALDKAMIDNGEATKKAAADKVQRDADDAARTTRLKASNAKGPQDIAEMKKKPMEALKAFMESAEEESSIENIAFAIYDEGIKHAGMSLSGAASRQDGGYQITGHLSVGRTRVLKITFRADNVDRGDPWYHGDINDFKVAAV